ncbi:hypothetical protein CLCR_05254 [Cladophialophora carrionii]|uniref:Uncharacterized protein n=1 Tax=Cladophialophora carrionii TaxID=86049 RepID=A0A1C1CLN8_9EURO|nr:hypothetical protein CLCR_05254 [Cladophialophora carrionii]
MGQAPEWTRRRQISDIINPNVEVTEGHVTIRLLIRGPRSGLCATLANVDGLGGRAKDAECRRVEEWIGNTFSRGSGQGPWESWSGLDGALDGVLVEDRTVAPCVSTCTPPSWANQQALDDRLCLPHIHMTH